MHDPAKLVTPLALLAAVFAGTGCRSGSFDQRSLPPPPDPTAAPQELSTESLYVPGEYLAFSVKWKGLAGGVTRWIVGEPGTLDGRAAIIAKSETKGDGLVAVFRHIREELTTVVDLEGGGPSRSESVIEKGRDVEELDVSFNGASYHATMRLKDEPTNRSWEQKVPEATGHADDLHTAMAHLRLWQPPDGTRGYLFAQSGQSFYRVEVVASGREQVETDAGTFDTIRLEGTAKLLTFRGEPPKQDKYRRFTMWFSADDKHLPVRIVGETAFGDVFAELTEHMRPDGARPLRLTHSAH